MEAREGEIFVEGLTPLFASREISREMCAHPVCMRSLSALVEPRFPGRLTGLARRANSVVKPCPRMSPGRKQRCQPLKNTHTLKNVHRKIY